MKTLRRSELWRRFASVAAMVGCFLVTTPSAYSQTYRVLKSFGVRTNIMGLLPRAELIQGPDGTLYGTTSSGDGNGTVFSANADGTGYRVLKWFGDALEGANPYGGLVLSDTNLYGTTCYGGISNCGTVFKLSVDGTGFTILKQFTWTDGARPYAGLVLSGDDLYGTTYYGGISNYYGTVFTLKTDGTGFALLKDFSSGDGANPCGKLVLSNGVLYGTTYYASFGLGSGTVFRLNTDGSGYTALKGFTGYSDGMFPYAGVTLSQGVLYGTTYSGGTPGHGTVFKLNTDGTGYAVLTQLGSSSGWNPYGGVVVSGSTLYGTTYTDGNSDYGTVYKINADGTGYGVLKQFGGVEGTHPYGSLLLSGGTLFGTTYNGGGSGQGTIFKLNTNATGFATLTQFTHSETCKPIAGLTLAGNTLFGTTSEGGNSGKGSVFQIALDGSGFTVLKYFTNAADGVNPYARLTLSNNMLYGTASKGGNFDGGTVFKVNTNGTGFTVLKLISGNPQAGVTLAGNTVFGTTYRGGNPSKGTVYAVNTDGTGYRVLIEFGGTNGLYAGSDLTLSGSTLYGTTRGDGNSSFGTVFKIDTNGTGFAVLKYFNLTDGYLPLGSLALSGGTLYGTTDLGGTPHVGTVFRINTNGTAFTNLLSMGAWPGGWYPNAGVCVRGNTLYGTTAGNGVVGRATAFKVNTDGGNYASLKVFQGTDGDSPSGDLVLVGTKLYGTTYGGGDLGLGTIFSIELAPQFTSVQPETNGSVDLTLTGEPARECNISASTDFVTWQLLATVTNATGTVFYTDIDATNFPARFYRAVQLP